MQPSSTSRLFATAAALFAAGSAATAQPPYQTLPAPPILPAPITSPWIPSLHIFEAIPPGIPNPPSPNILLQLRDAPPSPNLYGAAQMGVASTNGMFSAIATSYTLPPFPIGNRSDVVYNAEDAEDLIIANLSGTSTFDPAKGAIRFSTTPPGAAGFPADVERMTILSNGNVGIGKTTPQTTTWIEGMPVTSMTSTVSYGSILEIYDAQGATLLPSYGGIGFGSLPGVDFSIGKKTVSHGETYFQIRAQNGTEFVTVDQTGNTGIGSNDPVAKLEVKDGNVVFGGSGGGPLNLGTGTRMMWLQPKGAFRAGITYGTEWDDANVGDFSVAMGLTPTASGNYSTAIGDHATATGNYSTAIGARAHATGTASSAFGNGVTAQAFESAAFGTNNVVAGTPTSWVATDPLFVVGNGTFSSSDALTILKNGNVGVGTHTAPPVNALDVTGGAVIGSSVAGSVTAPANGLIVEGKVGLNTPAPRNQLDVAGSAVFGFAYAGTVSAISNSVLVEGEVGIGYTTNPGTYKLYVNGRSYYNDHATYNGEVGIGYTTNPGTYRLYVNGTSYFNGNAVHVGNGNYSGEVGIGYTTNPGVYKLYVNGDQYLNGTGTATGSWTTSDAKWKKNVEPITDALAKVTSLRGVSYDWRNDEFPEINFPEGHQIGFIAQEIEKVVPEVVHTDARGDKFVAYQNLTALLAEAIKEQQGTIAGIASHETDLKADNAKLTADNQAMRAQIDEQSARIARLELALQKLAENTRSTQAKSSLASSSTSPNEAQLFQNDPNPFSESTSIGYFLPSSVGHAELIVYSAASGKEVARQAITATGRGSVVINGRDLGSGTYYYTMIADGATVHGKSMIVVK